MIPIEVDVSKYITKKAIKGHFVEIAKDELNLNQSNKG